MSERQSDRSGSAGGDRESLLRRILDTLRTAASLSEILTAAATEVRAYLSVDRVKLYAFQPDESGQTIAEARAGDRLPSLLGLYFPASDIPVSARHAFASERQRVIIDLAAGQCITDRFDPDTGCCNRQAAPVDPCHREYLAALGVNASLVVPLLVQARLWGLLIVHHSQPRAYDETEVQTVQLVADQVAIAITQSQLLQQAREQAEREEALNQISHLLHAASDTPAQLQAATAAIVSATGSDGGRLYLHGSALQPPSYHLYQAGIQPLLPLLEVTPFWQQWLAEPHVAEGLPFYHAAAVPAFSEFEVHQVADLSAPETPRALAALFRGTAIRRLAIVPLQYRQRCIGCLTLFRSESVTERLWAGRPERDRCPDQPRHSFAPCRAPHRTRPLAWTSEEVKAMKTLALHLYVAISEHRLRQTLEHQAYRDRLTELPNRLHFAELLAAALADNPPEGDRWLAVLFLDLDGFKTINDSFGHAIGDRLLQQVAQRVQSCLRSADVVARWGGDEFTVLLPELSSVRRAESTALKILAALSAPLSYGGRDLYLKGSIGIALAPHHGNDAETLLKHADAALYQAKQQGRNRFQVYTPDLGSQIQARLLLEHSLYKAIEQEELLLYYQPQLSLATREIVGVEALLRWQSASQGWVSPAQFIPVAEETGTIVPIGEWVLRTACRQLQQWQQQGLPPLRVAVNLSARQFREPQLLQTIMRALEETGVDPSGLELEITESAVMQDVTGAIAVLKRLRQLGVQIAIDDFGTGYSSLAALKHFPIDTLKIDRSFVSELGIDAYDAAIVQAVMAISRGLNLAVVAEGVETAAQLEFLSAAGCDLAQGFWIGRPLPAGVLAGLLQAGKFAHIQSA